MGVPGLAKLIQRHAPDAFITLPITSFAGKRLAIDAYLWMHANMATARKKVISRTDFAREEPDVQQVRKEWINAGVTFAMTLVHHQVTPVFVFDGKDKPGKEGTQQERHDKHLAARAKIDSLYTSIRENGQTPVVLDELRKELINYNRVTYEDVEMFKTVIHGIGIPCVQANGDGEQVCSMLCLEGRVAGVFSTDMDNLAYGCPLLLRGFSDKQSYDSYGNKVPAFDCIRMDKILHGMGIPYRVFVDLCIMAGCDFNTNMPGIAAIKSFKLLQDYGSIDNLPRNFNTDCLKYAMCREIFAHVPSSDIIINDDISDSDEITQHDPLNINKQAIHNAREYLDMTGLGQQINVVITCYNNLQEPTDGLVESLQLQPIPRYSPPRPPAPVLALTQKFLTLKIVK